MSATHILINLVGEIALLLWGIHMIQSGVTRVLGTDLRRTLGRGLSTRFRAFMVYAARFMTGRSRPAA